MRWNGTANNPIGNPQSTGYATWFVIPDEFRESVLENRNISQDDRALVRNIFDGHQRAVSTRR
jgi:hypothetical protein